MKSKWAHIGAACFLVIAGLRFPLRGRQTGDEKRGGKAEGLTLDRETQKRIGLELWTLKPVAQHRAVTVYGFLEGDPSEEFVLRSPLTGVIAAGEGNWPSLGGTVREGETVGVVRPRLTAMDQLTLRERLASARTGIEGAQSSVDAARGEVDRLRQLNADNKNVSDKALQEAVARLAAETAALQSAQSSVQLIEETLRPESNAGAAALPLPRGGQVLEVAAQPGESVESGQMLIRIASFHHLLARVSVPPGQIIDASVTRAAIAPAGSEGDEIPGKRVALTPSVDPKFQGQTLLFRISPGKMALRPGQAITARLATPGPEERGVLIPLRAILRFQGLTWVYVRTGDAAFVRRAVVLDHSASGGWLAASGFQPGQRVVVSGAQLLLSEEMKSQLEPDQD